MPQERIHRTGRRARVAHPAILIIAASLAFAPATARAQGELAMRWAECAPGGAIDLVQACQFNIGERRIVMSFVPGADVTQVVGWTIVMDLASDAATLPSWWQFQPGGCRAGQLAGVTGTGTEGDCVDAWSATGSALIQSVIYPRPGGDGRQLRVILGVGVAAQDAFTLTGSQPYLAGELALYFANTTGTTCPGCDAPICLVFNSAEIVRLPGAPGPSPSPFVTPSPTYGNLITSNGGTACLLVPVRTRTWGQIKSLYR